MSALDDERLVLGQLFEVLLDEAVLHPVLADLSCLAIGDKFVWIEGDVEAQVVVNHHLEGFPFDTSSLVFVDGFGLKVALGAETVSIDFASCQELVHELGRKLFVQLFGDIAQGVFQGRGCLGGGKAVASVRSPAYSLHEGGIVRQCVG